MDFSFINELSQALNSNNIFHFTFTGGKVLALGLLLFRILESYMKDFDDLKPRLGNTLSLIGYGMIIMSSDWIINGIEHVFAGVDVQMGNTSSDLYTEMEELLSENFTEMFSECTVWYDYIGVFFSSLLIFFTNGIYMLISTVLKLADLSITAGYLLQRIFILKLLQFLFPLAVALSTYTGTAKLFHTWILRYIGIFIVGIAYIGIIHFVSLVQSSIMHQFSGYGQALGMLCCIAVVFTTKVKLFSVVTSYVHGMFS